MALTSFCRPDSKWAPSYLDGKRAFTVLYSATSKKDSSVYIKRPMAVITHGDELEGQRVKRFNITSFKSVFRSAMVVYIANLDVGCISLFHCRTYCMLNVQMQSCPHAIAPNRGQHWKMLK